MMRLSTILLLLAASLPLVAGQQDVQGRCCAFANCGGCLDGLVSRTQCFEQGYLSFDPFGLLSPCVTNPNKGGDPNFGQMGTCCAFANCDGCLDGLVLQTECFAQGHASFDPFGLLSPCIGNPSTGGDPHFKTWAGHKYDYHGECDLTLITAPEFGSGKGLEMQIRTERSGYHSSVERAVIKIDNDVVEVTNQGEFFVNGEPGIEGSSTELGGYPLHHILQGEKPSVLQVKISEYEWINFEARHDMLFTAVVGGDSFKGSLGMMGDHETGKMIGRDGETEIEDPDEFALEWQVRGPSFFRSAREPVYPAQCLPAGEKPPRLGESIVRAAAEAACSLWGAATKEDCVFDVVAMRSMEVAKHHDVHENAHKTLEHFEAASKVVE